MTGQSPRQVNVAAVELESFPGLPDGFRPGIARVGKLLGATRTGMSVYELPPGEAIGPYHYEDPEEEWVLVVEGRPTPRRPGREEGSSPGTSSSSRLALTARTRCATTPTRPCAC
jgi:uncharacterized cupin superfamily protein